MTQQLELSPIQPYRALCVNGNRISLWHGWSLRKPVRCEVCGELLPVAVKKP